MQCASTCSTTLLCIKSTRVNPLTPRSDQDRISPYNIKQTSDENKEKYQLGDYKLIQYQILHANITRTVWQTIRRITNEILGVKGLKTIFLFLYPLCILLYSRAWFHKLVNRIKELERWLWKTDVDTFRVLCCLFFHGVKLFLSFRSRKFVASLCRI